MLFQGGYDKSLWHYSNYRKKIMTPDSAETNTIFTKNYNVASVDNSICTNLYG